MAGLPPVMAGLPPVMAGLVPAISAWMAAVMTNPAPLSPIDPDQDPAIPG
jgi:hypothetical protein